MNETTIEEPPKEQPQKTAGGKITIEVDEDNPCLRKDKAQERTTSLLGKHIGYDPRCTNNESMKVCCAHINSIRFTADFSNKIRRRGASSCTRTFIVASTFQAKAPKLVRGSKTSSSLYARTPGQIIGTSSDSQADWPGTDTRLRVLSLAANTANENETLLKSSSTTIKIPAFRSTIDRIIARVYHDYS